MYKEKKNKMLESAIDFIIQELKNENEKSPAMIIAIAELISQINKY